MKFIHLADLHIGKKLAGYSLLEDQVYIFRQILEEAERFKPDCFFIAGDVYDRAIPSEEAVRVYEDFIAALSEMAPVYIISGNHDSGTRLSLFSEFLEKNQIYIEGSYTGELTVKELDLGDEHINIYLLPYFSPPEIRPILGEERLRSYEEALEKILEGLELDDSAINILLTHQFYLNHHDEYESVPEGSERPVIGGLDDIRARFIKDFDYAALGHIHGMREVGSPRIRYPGTPLKYSVGESDKYLNCVTLTKDDVEVEKIPLKPLREVRKIEGYFKDLIEGEKSEDYVFVSLLDNREIPNIKKSLLEVYPNLLGISFENLIRENIRIREDEEILKKGPIELLQDFYDQLGEELSEKEMETAKRIFAELEEENE